MKKSRKKFFKVARKLAPLTYKLLSKEQEKTKSAENFSNRKIGFLFEGYSALEVKKSGG